MKLLLVWALSLASPALAQREVTVVRPDGTPAVGAEVRWIEGGPSTLEFGALEDAAIASGNLLVADERGSVSLPNAWVTPEGVILIPPPGIAANSRVIASAPGLWACQLLRPTDASARLQLRPDADLIVETVDAEGAPVGDVPVVLRFVRGRNSSSIASAQSIRTDPTTGRGVLRHANFTLDTLSDVSWPYEAPFDEASGLIESEPGWFVQVMCDPAPSGARVPCPQLPSATPVRLSVAGLVRIDVTFRDLNGPATWQPRELVTDPFHALVDTDGYSSGVISFNDWGRTRPGVPLGPTETLLGGRASVWAAAGGRTIYALLRRNPLSDALVARIDPSKVDDRGALEVLVNVQARTGQPQLRAQRIRPHVDGEPIAHSSLVVRRSTLGSARPPVPNDRGGQWPEELNESHLSGAYPVVTDADGVFEIDSRLPGAALLVKLEQDGRAALFGGTSETAWFDSGEIVDLPLRADPRSFSGLVLDEAGAPIEGARITIFGALNGQIRIETDANGRFAFDTRFSEMFGGDVEAPGRFSSSFRDWSGESPLVVTLHRHAAVRGVLRVTDPHGPVDLNLLLLRHEGEKANDKLPGQTLGCSCDGEFSFDALEPGRYTLIVRRARSGAKPLELATIERFEVQAGETHDLGEIPIR